MALLTYQGGGRKTVDAFFASETRAPADELQRGWERNVLLSLFFGPSPESLVDPEPAFRRLEGRWIVAPVTDSLVYRSRKVQPELKRWVADVGKWDVKYISPSHFRAAPGTSKDWTSAFSATLGASTEKPYCERDAFLLEGISAALTRAGVI